MSVFGCASIYRIHCFYLLLAFFFLINYLTLFCLLQTDSGYTEPILGNILINRLIETVKN